MKETKKVSTNRAGKKKADRKRKKFATGGGEQTDLVLERSDHHQDSAVPQNKSE